MKNHRRIIRSGDQPPADLLLCCGGLVFVFVPALQSPGVVARLATADCRTRGPDSVTAARRASFVPKYRLCPWAVILAAFARINHPNNARSQRFQVCQIPRKCPLVCIAQSVAAFALCLPASAKERFQLPQTIHDFQPLLTHCPRPPFATASTVSSSRHTAPTPHSPDARPHHHSMFIPAPHSLQIPLPAARPDAPLTQIRSPPVLLRTA